MKHCQTKAPKDITCNSQETFDIFGTKYNKNSTVFAKRQYYFLNERMKLIPPKSRNNLPNLAFQTFLLSFSRFIKYLHNFERYSSGNNELLIRKQ